MNNYRVTVPASFVFTLPACMLTVSLLLTGCGKKEEKVEVQEEKPEVVEQVETRVRVEAPKKYAEADKQQEFEKKFEAAAQIFNPPAPGMLVRAEPESGTPVAGELIRYVKDGVVIASGEEAITFNKDELKDNNQTEFFVEAFAESLASLQIDSGFGDEETGGKAIYPPKGTQTLETRFMSAERLVPRAGPGRQYGAIEENAVFRGSALRVRDEISGWICIQEDAENAPILGWIPKHATGMPFTTRNDDMITRDVDKLREDGFVIDIKPEMNEALVDSYLWRTSDSASVEGISRLLARYIALQKNTRVFFVVIKDNLDNRIVAEFSESRGLKVF
jgi:hypothetical protein